MSKLPEITHLQFLVLETLAAGEQPGRDLRASLATHGIRRTAPAFYQMMSRLEDAGLAAGWYEQTIVSGHILKERRYRLTRPGARALTETRAFYVAHRAATASRKVHV